MDWRNYVDEKPHIIVRFITMDEIFSDAIRKITGSLFSHVEYGTPDFTWIGSHDRGGVQERKFDYCNPTREYVYAIPCEEVILHAAVSWMRGSIGTPYNYRDIIGLLFQARTLTNPHRLICSQFVCEGLLNFFGPKRVLNVELNWTYRISPETLHLSPIFAGNLISRKG